MTENRVIPFETHKEGFIRLQQNLEGARRILGGISRLQNPSGSTALTNLAEDGFITLNEVRILATRKGFMDEQKEEIKFRLAQHVELAWNRLALTAQYLLLTSAPEAIPLALVAGDYLKPGTQDLIAQYPFGEIDPVWEDLFASAQSIAINGGMVTFPSFQASGSSFVVTLTPDSQTHGSLEVKPQRYQAPGKEILKHDTPVQIARAMLKPNNSS